MLKLDVLRNVGEAEFAVVSELLSAAERADGQQALSDHLWLDLRLGGRQGFAAIVGVEDGHDHLVAYSQVSRGNESWSIDLVVHPHHRYDMASIGPRMIDAALSVVRSEGGGHVHWWVFEPSDIYYALAKGAGLSPGRELLQMRRPLPLEAAHIARIDDFATRPFVFDADADTWLAVNNSAFATHPEQGSWDLTTLRARMVEPWFDADGFLIHDDPQRTGEMAGFCWTKIHPGNAHGTVGEIYVIAVNPTYVGKGLGSRLTIAGLDWLARKGCTTGMLYVDRENHAAVAMYEKLGFTAHHRERAFVGDVH